MQTEVAERSSDSEQDSPVMPSKRKSRIYSDDEEESKGGSVGEPEQKVNAPSTLFYSDENISLTRGGPAKRNKSPSEKIDRANIKESVFKSTSSNFPTSQLTSSQHTKSLNAHETNSELFYSCVDVDDKTQILRGNIFEPATASFANEAAIAIEMTK